MSPKGTSAGSKRTREAIACTSHTYRRESMAPQPGGWVCKRGRERGENKNKTKQNENNRCEVAEWETDGVTSFIN